MQLTGGQFTLSTALAGNDLATFPDFPAEIRAPQGTTFGVSAFQINFGSTAIETAGDQPDVLIAMNPAALKVNAAEIRDGGLIIADEGEFTARNLAKAGYATNPLEDGSLARWRGLTCSSAPIRSLRRARCATISRASSNSASRPSRRRTRLRQSARRSAPPMPASSGLPRRRGRGSHSRPRRSASR